MGLMFQGRKMDNKQTMHLKPVKSDSSLFFFLNQLYLWIYTGSLKNFKP